MLYPAGDIALADNYVSNSQKARVITEAWVEKHGYCLACENDLLSRTSANTKARDFECSLCGHAYELKSSISRFGKRVTDGAYSSMLDRINNSTVLSFLLLQYTPAWTITNLSVIHHSLITHNVIERRKPLALTARRAGWIGCNILLGNIPPEGKISLIVDGKQLPKRESRASFAAAEQLSSLSVTTRGWASATLSLLHKMGKEEFSIENAYSLEPDLGRLFPSNKHVKAKIRQQLQVLRDAGMITFKSRGNYQFTKYLRKN